VVDVGGNVGLYTVFLSRLVGNKGRVFSFEPDPDLFGLLKQNCSLNNCSNVQSFNLAVGSQRDQLNLQKLIANTGDNYLSKDDPKFFRRTVRVDVVTIDEFLPTLRPSLVKIDVQGWEFEVLKGMDTLLSNSRKTNLYLELWPQGLRRAGASLPDVIQWLKDRDFQLYRADNLEHLSDHLLTNLEKEARGLKHIDIYATREPIECETLHDI
jgi:FkbM family methyltransferase